MRDVILGKFKDIRHKWFTISLESKVFYKVIDDITSEVNQGNINASDAIELVSLFKKRNKAWIKLKSISGRNDIVCKCVLITSDNKKIKTELSGSDVLYNATVLSETPRKLKLYKVKKDILKWIKPNDDFYDDCKIPIEEELSEDGYYLYRAFQLELRKLNISAKEYYERFC
jgi:hypothetical protein